MKYLSYGLIMALFFTAESLSGQEVVLSVDHPSRVNAGEEFTVTVTINKGSLTDYSRFSQDLPLGLTATNISSPNADFSFEDQRIRIIWLKMPETSKVTVSYSIQVDPRLKGSFFLGGIFAFVVQDERKFLNVEQSREISIVPNPSMDPSQIVDIQDFTGEPLAEPSPAAAEESFAMVVRQKPRLEDSGAYLVRLLVKNPTGSKYAKIEETIPEGYLFEEVNSSEGIVSHAASTVKFIWMKLPEESEFELVYRLVPKQNEAQGSMQISGMLSYTIGNENKEADIREVNVNLDGLTTAQKRYLLATGRAPAGSPAEPTASNRRETPSPRTVNETPRETVNETPSRQERQVRESPPAPLMHQQGLSYRVQLAAHRNPIDAQAFFRGAGIEMEVQVEQHQGLYKYTVGPFGSYQEAMNYRNRVDRLAEVRGAFVVSYRDGVRIN